MEGLSVDQPKAHKRFGVSSEKRDERLMEQLSFLFNEAEVFSAVKEEEDTTVVAAHTRRKKHEYTLDSIPEEQPENGSNTVWRERHWCAPSAVVP